MRMAFRKFSQSIYDTLIRLMPSLQKDNRDKNFVDPTIANSLFNIWRTSSNKINDNTYQRPATVSIDEVKNMQKAGLVRPVGNNIEITNKGSEVIKIMILGDDTSSFDPDVEVDYTQALKSAGQLKSANKVKVASWWDRF